MKTYQKLQNQVKKLSSYELKQMCKLYDFTKHDLPLPKWIYACFLPMAYCMEQTLSDAVDFPFLTSDARIDLQRILVERLGYLGKSVCFKLILDREKRRGASCEETGIEGICLYMIEEGYEGIAREYLILRQLIERSLDDYLALNLFFLKQLKTDWEELKPFCGNPTEVTGIFQEMKELHPFDKNVHIISFENSQKLVFKGEYGQHHRTWSLWCEALDRVAQLRLFLPREIVKEHCLWQEYIPHTPVQSPDELAQYYEHAGELLCVLYLMNAKDIQFENVIAYGQYPVLIDIETVLNAPLSNEPATVKDTYFLPGCQSLQYVKNDMAAMAWDDNRKSLPYFAEKTYPVKDYTESLCVGFTNAYKQIQQQKSRLEPEAFWNQSQLRYVMRPTWAYALLLERGLCEKCLKNDTDYAIALSNSHLLEHEKQMLHQGYIPVFYQHGNSRGLYSETGTLVTEYFSKTPSDTLRFRLEEMCQEDLDKQLHLIRECCLKKGSAS